MDIVTLGAALNGSAEYVNSHFKGGSNIQIVDNPDGTQTINASGEVSAEDTVARAEIAEMKDGTTLDSFGDVETALADKADSDNVYKLALSDADLLPANTDLDNVKTVGSYYVYNSVNVTTIANKPTNNTSAFRLTVEYAAGEKRARQIYQEFNSFDKYIRFENSSNVFSEWKKVECDLSTKQNTISDLSTIRSGAALGATAVQPETGKGLSTNDYTAAEKTKLAGIADGAEVNVQSNWTQTTTTADDYIKNKPTLGTAAAKNATDTYNATGTDVTTGKAVAAALATLPEPMVFKGSLGTGGTITTLPSASSSNKGYVYKVITAGTYASQSAKAGDTFISDGSAWVLIPSGDEPSGTVTNVAVANGGGLTVSGSPITTSGTITVGHSNSVTAETSSSVKKFTYDAYGHVTGSSELSTAESNALASGIDSTKVEQIETNKSNISLVCDANGKKQLIPNFGTLTSGTITYAQSGTSITVSGTKQRGSLNYVNICTAPYSAYGLKEGDTIVVKNSDASFVYVAIGFDTGSYSGTPTLVIGSNELTVPSGKTHMFIRIGLLNSVTDVNETIKPLVCDKKLYSISPTITPYAMSNAELTAKEQTNENNILYGYSALTSDLLNVADKTMKATGFVFQETPVSLKANTEYIFYVTIDGKAPMNLVGYTTGQSGRTVDITVTTKQQEIGINAIKFTPPANVNSMSLYINYQSTDITYSGMRITQEYSEIHLIQLKGNFN